MYPDYSTSEAPKSRRLLILAAVVLGIVIVLIILASTLLTTNPTKRSLSKTPFTTHNFPQLIGSEVYTYDGLAFTKTNIDSQQTTVLSKGMKLPNPRTLFWAEDKGALLNFTDGFTLSQVQTQLQANGEDVDDTTMNYTWFLDFKDNSLHKVSDNAIIGDSVMYSATAKGFYYIADIGEAEGGDAFTSAVYPLHFYNTETNTDRVVSEDLRLSDASYLGECSDQKYAVCVVGREENSLSTQQLFGVAQDGTKTSLLKSSGRLIPTNSPNLYITTDQKEAQTSTEEDAGYSEAPAKLHDLKDNTTTDLKFTIASQIAFPYITSKEDYFVLMANPVNGSEVQYISSGKTRLGTLGVERPGVTYDDNKPYESGFRSSWSYGDNGAILVADITGDTLLFRESSQQKQLTRLDQAAAKKVVDTCVKTTADSSEYIADTTTFQIFFMGEEGLADKVSSFSDCIDKANRQVLLGYGFMFAARDASNGRITTD